MTRLPPKSENDCGTGRYRATSDQAIEHEARKAKLIQQPLDLWQPRTSRQLTEEDARQMIDNAVGVFRLLLKWRHEELMAENGDQPSKGEHPE